MAQLAGQEDVKSQKVNKSLRVNEGVVLALQIVVASMLFLTGSLAGDWHPQNVIIAFSLSLTVLFLLNMATSLIVRNAVLRRQISEKKEEITTFSAVLESVTLIADLLERRIELAISNEELTMFQSERRANTLYALGQFFLVGSVFGPIIALVAYWFIDPLPSSTLANLVELKEKLGDLPGDLSVSVQRDWRILLGGVSFGFLLLTAAAGLLRQQAREIAVYFRISERVNFFRRLKSVIEIKQLGDRPEVSQIEIELIDLVSRTLLHANSNRNEDVEVDDAVHTDGLLDAAKAFKSATN